MRTGAGFGRGAAIGVAAADVGLRPRRGVDDLHGARHLERDLTVDTAMR